MKSTNCLECDGEPLNLPEDVLMELSEEELEKYLRCEDYFRLNTPKGPETHSD